ncbi:hypothetical protein M5M_07560 [Simiduia agarivorans SA1 = DSM 21679]|uniref:Uncharacterized protein n=1 Tax=Simiduia agarivorans (strain DSM 21679 / JCM 13881 / BCRC 17597 / SA1) TaxID=1117647 RepID=K4KKY5_SIMAS|nr:hypothetical protein M5M_07560 [Simiduia agarivorans SA1 = DSM 21679]
MKSVLSCLVTMAVCAIPLWAKAAANTCDLPKPLPDNIQVLIATDHTLPQHYGEASAGAEGREREYIDPAARAFAAYLAEQNLGAYVLTVEDQHCSGRIEDKAGFNQAYARYDALLKQAVAAGFTIVALHFDADRLPPEASLADAHYIGGVQLIIDSRAISPATASLTDYLLNDVKLLQHLGSTGLRLRPDYETRLREQNNQTLHIAGHSAGGAFLLELGSQQQARTLFGQPDQVVNALQPSLALLAGAIAQWRKGNPGADIAR